MTRRESKAHFMIYLICLIYILSCSLGIVLVKYGGKDCAFRLGGSTFEIRLSGVFLAGILLYVVSFFLWIYLIQKFQVTYISPVAYGLSFISMAVFSFLILKEALTIQQMIGAALIVVGVLVSSIK